MKKKKHTEPRLCGCGCGQITKQARDGTYNRYVKGHNPKHSKSSQTSNNGQFKTGNAFGQGRPCGSRNRVTVASENLIEGEGEALTRKLIELALDGNIPCLRAAIDRLHPVKRSAPVRLPGMPMVKDIESATMASAYLLEQVSEGKLSPADAETVGRLVEKYIGAIKWFDVEQRLNELQEKLDKVT